MSAERGALGFAQRPLAAGRRIQPTMTVVPDAAIRSSGSLHLALESQARVPTWARRATIVTSPWSLRTSVW